MKGIIVKMFFVGLVLFLAGTLTAQTRHSSAITTAPTTSIPLKMSYQGLLTIGGNPVTDGSYDMTVALFDSLTNGSPQWSEVHAGVAVQHGTFNIILGTTTPLNLQFNASLFVQLTTTNGPAGPTYPLTFSPRSELMSSPYSLAPWVSKGSDIYYKNGKIGMGSAAPESSGIDNLRLDIADEDGSNGNVAIRVAGQNIDGGGYPSLNFAKSRGSFASPAKPTLYDNLGRINFLGYDGSGYQKGAAIHAWVEGTPTVGKVPTSLSFFTSSIASAYSEKMKLDGQGNLHVDQSDSNHGALNPGLVFGDYTGEGIGSNRNSGQNLWGLDFYTSFINRMSITNGGYVGIATTSPYQTLSINGTIGFKDGSTPLLMNAESCCGSGSRMLWAHSPTYPTWGIYYDDILDNFHFRQSSGNEIFTVSMISRNIGIGNANPLFPLSFSNSLGDKVALWGQSGKHYGFGIQPGVFQVYADTATSDIAFGWGQSTSFSEIMRMKGSGRVGIGTTSPANKLSVFGNADFSGSVGIGTSSPTNAFSVAGNADISGNVGIGTSTLTERLTVGGSMTISTPAAPYQHYSLSGGNSNGYIYGDYGRYPDAISIGYNYTTNGSGGYTIPNTGGPTSRISMYYGAIGMFVGGVNAEPTTLGVWVTNAGNVGIGTQSPAQKLGVSGSVCASGFVSCSDFRYKREISTLTSSLEKITSLRGVSYFWRTDEFPEKNFSKGKQIGLIAQEVEQVYPEVVVTDDKGYKSIDYSHLTPALVEAIKELNEKVKEIDALHHELNELRAIVKSLAAEKNWVGDKSMGELK